MEANTNQTPDAPAQPKTIAVDPRAWRETLEREIRQFEGELIARRGALALLDAMEREEAAKSNPPAGNDSPAVMNGS